MLPGEERKVTHIKIDADDLEQYCEQTRAGYRDLLSRSWLAERSVLLSYEELLDRPGYWLRHQICPLIGVEAVTPQVKLLKQNTQPLSATVANYAQVKNLLLSCRQYHQWPEVARRRVA